MDLAIVFVVAFAVGAGYAIRERKSRMRRRRYYQNRTDLAAILNVIRQRVPESG
jgi:hypothetical protein